MRFPKISKLKLPDRGWHVFGRPFGLVLLIAYKLLWGSVEFASGILIFFSYRLITRELLEDPQDLFSNWLLQHFHLSYRGTIELGLLVSTFGLGKFVLGLGLWFRIKKIREFAMFFFSLIAAYGAYHLITRFTLLKFAAELMDVFIIVYLWKVLPKHLRDQGIAGAE